MDREKWLLKFESFQENYKTCIFSIYNTDLRFKGFQDLILNNEANIDDLILLTLDH